MYREKCVQLSLIRPSIWTGHPTSHLISAWRSQITNCAGWSLTKATWEEGVSIEESLPSDQLVGIAEGHFLNCE